MIFLLMNTRRSVASALFAVLLTATLSQASTYISVGDEIYSLLSRLEAEGVITDAVLSIKPLSRKEVVRLTLEAETNSAARSEFIRDLVQELKRRVRPEEYQAGTLKPVESVYAGVIDTNAEVRTLSFPGARREMEQALNYNNDGDLYGHGANERVGLTSRLDDLGPFSVFLNPEYRSGEDGQKGVLRTGYAVLGFSWIDIVAGKDSQWWGPGQNGANLLSNNAEPLTMIKFTGPEPQVLPWVFKYLGPFQYTLFVARLEDDRSDFSKPYFDGIRLSFKPVPYLEIGLERVTLLGGAGRPLSNGQWVRSFFGASGHPSTTSSDYTDTEAGGDVKLTLPLTIQPLQVYWQRDGEDSRQRRFGFPYKFADLYGLYLPRVLEFERLSVRAEYAVNHVSGWPDVWYTHSNYTAGMTYNGMIIGHHMGTDSRDLFTELTCRFPEQSARVSLAYDSVERNLSMDVHELDREVSLNARLNLSKNVDLEVEYGFARIENAGLVAGTGLRDHSAGATVTYSF
jgi:hypothetical protein